jgi:hypothetical protein
VPESAVVPGSVVVVTPGSVVVPGSVAADVVPEPPESAEGPSSMLESSPGQPTIKSPVKQSSGEVEERASIPVH